MASRYIQDGKDLWFAWAIERHYEKPKRYPGGLQPKPQFYIIADLEEFLLVIDYHQLEYSKKPDTYSPLYGQPKLIPKWHLVQHGDPIPAELVLAGNPRVKEIELELDIIRGRVPTPKGYKIDKGKIKTLMAELKAIRQEMGV